MPVDNTCSLSASYATKIPLRATIEMKMDRKIWCPYTDIEVEINATSTSPLPLGGSNNFAIPVDAASF